MAEEQEFLRTASGEQLAWLSVDRFGANGHGRHVKAVSSHPNHGGKVESPNRIVQRLRSEAQLSRTSERRATHRLDPRMWKPVIDPAAALSNRKSKRQIHTESDMPTSRCIDNPL